MANVFTIVADFGFSVSHVRLAHSLSITSGLRGTEMFEHTALKMVATVALAAGVLSAIAIALHIACCNRQKMKIMNVVWPLTALYAGPLALWAYFKLGGSSGHQQRPFWQSAVLGTTHCGSGCTLGDILAESFVVLVPVSLFGKAIFGTWAIDYVAAFVIGIAFQYFSIKPMRDLSASSALKAALKADAASLTAWQIGMYGWMAIAVFFIFGHELEKSDPVFWFMMQIAMLFGFLTAYPVNRLLIRSGIKERM